MSGFSFSFNKKISQNVMIKIHWREGVSRCAHVLSAVFGGLDPPFLALTSNEDDDFELGIRQRVERSKEGTGVIAMKEVCRSGEPGGWRIEGSSELQRRVVQVFT